MSQKANDFSSLVGKIGSSTKVVFLPFQIASEAQLFAQQIKAAEAEIERAKLSARASIRDAAVGVAQAATQRLIATAPSDQQAGAAVDGVLERQAPRGAE